MTSEIHVILKELYGLQRLGIKVGLEHTEELLDKIGNPHLHLKFIHIAGTNGKGSTCAIINSILRKCGLVVGLYTSPHLVRFNERIQVNGEQISDADIALFMKNNYNEIKKIETTFFETTTAMAFDYFYRKSVDIAIIETGLGGRLDSTNVISPEVCGISSISLDHMDILGNTIQKIAKEKAGIIKENTPIVTIEQSKTIMDIIKKRAEHKNASLKTIKRNDIQLFSIDNQGASFKYKKYEINLPLKGEHQILNCVLAINIVESIINKIDPFKINEAIINTSWPGRMEKLSEKDIYYDVAHNYDGIKAMINTAKSNHPNKKLFGLFCVKGDKNIDSICNIIKKTFQKIIVCQDKEKYLMNVKELSKIMDEKKISYLPVNSLKEGIKTIRDINQEEYVWLIFGSHYIAKEVYSEFGKHFDTTYN